MPQNTSDQDADMQALVAEMTQEFLEGCEDRLDMIDSALNFMRKNKGHGERELMDIKRHVHSMKGLGGTFGFSSISLLAHALEDYFETLFTPSGTGVYDVQLFIDRIREISEIGENLSDDAVSALIRDLPLKAKARTLSKDAKALTILVLMPKGLQRKIVGSELAQFGFDVIMAEGAMDAIEKGLRRRPDVFMASVVTDELSGIELAGIFHAIQATSKSPFLLVSSSELSADEKKLFPPNLQLLRKGANFSRDLMAFFVSQDYVASARK